MTENPDTIINIYEDDNNQIIEASRVNIIDFNPYLSSVTYGYDSFIDYILNFMVHSII